MKWLIVVVIRGGEREEERGGRYSLFFSSSRFDHWPLIPSRWSTIPTPNRHFQHLGARYVSVSCIILQTFAYIIPFFFRTVQTSVLDSTTTCNVTTTLHPRRFTESSVYTNKSAHSEKTCVAIRLWMGWKLLAENVRLIPRIIGVHLQTSYSIAPHNTSFITPPKTLVLKQFSYLTRRKSQRPTAVSIQTHYLDSNETMVV